MQHDSKCVCEICTCGVHSCPSHKVQNYPGNDKTIFKQDYVPHGLQNNPSFKRKEEPFMKPYNKDDLQSIYNTDYYKKPTDASKWKRQQIPATTPIPFAQNSEYKNSYIPFDAEHKARPMTQQSKVQNIPFNNTTTYGNDFQNFKRNKPQKPNYNNNTGGYRQPIQKETTYNTDFLGHPFDPVKPTQSTHRLNDLNNNVPFQSQTIYNSEYQRFPNKFNDACPVTQLPSRPRECSPGKKHLNYNATANRWN